MLKSKPLLRRSTHGFTLIEALAALMLMAVVLPVAIQAISTASRLGSTTQRRALAMQLADTRMSEIILTGEWDEGDGVGEFDESYSDGATRYAWVLEVDDWNQPEFKQLTLYVTWETTRGLQLVKLSTVVSAEDQG